MTERRFWGRILMVIGAAFVIAGLPLWYLVSFIVQPKKGLNGLGDNLIGSFICGVVTVVGAVGAVVALVPHK